MRLKSVTRQFVHGLLNGREVDRDSEIDALLQRDELQRTSARIAAMLEDAGVNMITDRHMTAVGAITGSLEEITTYRNSNMIPVNQAMNHHGMLRDLSCHMDSGGSDQRRMLVIKGGWVDIPNYREEHRAHCRRMSRFAADSYLQSLGISVEYYNVENTVNWVPIYETPPDHISGYHEGVFSRPYLNMHSHAIIRCERYLGPKAWRAFLEYARRFFPGGYAHDGKILKAAEAVKYCFKGSEMIALGPIALKELYEQTKRLKFYHPLGAFKAFRRELRENGLKVKKLPIGDKWEWRAVEKLSREPIEPREIKDGDVILGHYDEAPPRIREHGYIRAILDPAPRFSATMEPTLLVEAFSGDLAGLLAEHGLSDWWARVRANRPLSIKDTTTITVRKKTKDIGVGHHPPPKSSLDDYQAALALSEAHHQNRLN